MKVIPSIFLFLTLMVFFCNCSDVTKKNDDLVINKISLFIEASDKEEIPFIDKKSAIDSAIVLSKTIQNDSLLLKSLSHKAFIYSYWFPDNSTVHIDELERTALKKNSLKHQAYASSLYGDYFYNLLQYDTAYYYFKKSNILYLDRGDSLRVGYNLIMMAKMHQFFNDYSGSEELAVHALNYLENTQNNDYIIEIYNILGHTYLENKNFQDAVIFYDKSLEFVLDERERFILENNKSAVYISWEKYDLAIQKLNELLSSESIGKYIEERALILCNLGFALFKMDSSAGLEEMEESLKIRDSMGHVLGKIESYIKLGEYFENKDKKVAIEHLRNALNLASEYNNIDNRLNALKILIRLSDKDETQKYSNDYIRLNDSIREVRQKAKNQFAKIRFDYSKEQEQNLLLKAKKVEDKLLIQKQKNTNQLLFFGILFIGGAGVFFYSFIRNRHKREKIKETYKTENRIAVRIHDELANDVYNTIAYTENSDLSVEENKLKLLDNLEDVYNRTRNISKENSTVDTGKYYVEYLKNMLSEYQKNELKIVIAGADNIQWEEMNSHKKIIVYRVLQELMVNMKKHSKASMVMLRFENQNKQVHIHYSDDGTGLSNEKIILKNGIQNVENRIKTINGTITFEPKAGKGLKVLITVPL